jgi:hypothetical protein
MGATQPGDKESKRREKESEMSSKGYRDAGREQPASLIQEPNDLASHKAILLNATRSSLANKKRELKETE